jgi:cellulose synthase operon protein C
MPAGERSETDHFRLLLGLIAGAGSGVGRHELFELLVSGSEPDQQRIALQLLVHSSAAGAARVELGERLDKLIAEPGPQPILESLLLCRAQLGLIEARQGVSESASLYARAEDDANALLEKFPGSPLKAQAYAVLAGSAWEQHRYRTAADFGFKAGGEIPEGPIRAEFSVLVAEAWFRAGMQGRDAGDFRSAADAYAAALRSHPEEVRPGVLMFQRVQSEIEAGALATAVSVLDELSRDRAFDPEYRWEAEWNLSRSLEVHGETEAAYERVNNLLHGAPAAGLRPDLRARMAWLQARLSFDARKPHETLALVGSLAALTEGLPPALANDIASTGALLRAQANFELGLDSAAEETLQKLRADFPSSDAAVYSYIVEADRFAQQDKVIDAERLLTKLADDFPNSPYAPYALYQAALQAERLGTDAEPQGGLQVARNPGHEPEVRLERPDIPGPDEAGRPPARDQPVPAGPAGLRVPGQQSAPHPIQRIRSWPSLRSPSATTPSRRTTPPTPDSAKRIFEDLVERVDATADVRVEAGYNLGVILSRTDRDKAQAVWWNDVVDAFLVKPGGPKDLGPKGRWWIARTLLDVGALYEQQGRLEEAKPRLDAPDRLRPSRRLPRAPAARPLPLARGQALM